MVLTFRHSRPPRASLRMNPDPADVDRLVSEAAAQAGRGQMQEALRTYQQALLADEGRADVWFHYGSLQRRLGLLADACESFEFALRQEPALFAARYQLACTRCDMGFPLEALSHLRIVTQERPTYLPAWRHLVQLSWAVGDRCSAAKFAQEALRRSPQDAQLQSLLTRVLHDRGASAAT